MFNEYTRCYTLVNTGNQDSQPQDNIVLEWLLRCTSLSTACTCMAPMRPNILCAPPIATPPITPTPPNTIHFKEFTYCHDIFPTTAVNKKKSNKYDPLVQAIRDKGWIVNPLITITTGAIHKSSIQALEKSQIPPRDIKILMRHIEQVAIKRLTNKQN